MSKIDEPQGLTLIGPRPEDERAAPKPLLDRLRPQISVSSGEALVKPQPRRSRCAMHYF